MVLTKSPPAFQVSQSVSRIYILAHNAMCGIQSKRWYNNSYPHVQRKSKFAKMARLSRKFTLKSTTLQQTAISRLLRTGALTKKNRESFNVNT